MSVLPAYPRVVDDVTVRLIAAEVLCVSVAAIALRNPWLYAILAVDFTVRAGLGPRWSPLARLARVIRPRVDAAPRPTAGPPKRFAAAIGAVFSIAILVFAALSIPILVWSLAAIMVLFPALESLLGICVGCMLFGLLIRAGVVPEEVCIECADISLRSRATSPRS